MSEKGYTHKNQKRNEENNKNAISFCELENNNNKEIYVLNNEPTLKRIVKCPVNPKWEKRLRKTARISQEQPEKERNMEVEEPPIIKKTTLQVKPKRKWGPLRVDSLQPYNVTDDILTLPTSATVGKILQ
ncbi:hypothetical protein C2G38_2028570 [Gigaspora rosea]|uniref:Uncharacterized protein n=1 Tax=Gigaspora rosea TaxID=44941 RepID=A0A397W2G2_9GLOM|nr:hypothetical protein C2G38_2028570 [Gigaspora rosea]